MARQLRLEFEGALYHISARGNARTDIYLNDTDRWTFLTLLGREIEQQGWLCYAYCLMGNHYHLLIETPEPNLSRGMRRLNAAYTQTFHRHHRRVGHLFQGRYKSYLVERENYWLELCRYIVLNPVRAGLVAQAQAWRWSSYRATAGQDPPPDWLQVSGLLEQFGGHRREALRAYRRFVREGIRQPSPWGRVRGQIFLGSDTFLERMERLTKGQQLDNVPSSQTRPSRLTQADVFDRVCDAYGLSQKAVVSRKQGEPYRCAAYLLRREANLSLKGVAALFGVSPSRISHIQRAMETKQLSPTERRLIMECKVKQRPQ